MSEQSNINQSLPAEAVNAMADAATHLQSDSSIDYRSFDADTMHALWLGPGVVERPVPDLLGPDWRTPAEIRGAVGPLNEEERSGHDLRDFGLYFGDSYLGRLLRRHAVNQRFEILFPELTTAATQVIPSYRSLRLHDRSAAQKEQSTAEFAQGVFRIMRHLIDANDAAYPELT